LISEKITMTVDDILSELKARYRYELDTDLGQQGLAPRMTAVDVERWCKGLLLNYLRLFDTIGIAVAVGFDTRDLNFAFCDAVVNDLRDTQDHRGILVQRCVLGRLSVLR
jgi:hypothetical protein